MGQCDTIGLDIELLTESIPSEVREFISTSGLDEEFDYANTKFLIVGKSNDEYVGCVAYGKFSNTDDGKEYPRFLHIIITPKFKRSKIAYKMLKESESAIKSLGYNTILCYIIYALGNRDMKRRYALKFGYLKYSEDVDGEYFYKNI